MILVGNKGSTQPYVLKLNRVRSTGMYIFNNHSLLGPGSLIHSNNGWREEELTDGERYELPSSVVRLYLPQYSVDTYSSGATYILCLFTFVHGTKLELGNYKFKRTDSLACSPVRFHGMEEYYEYIEFTIADPFNLLYADSAKGIRKALGEPEYTNNTEGLLHASLDVVESNEMYYIKNIDWEGGQDSVLISDPQDLKLSIDWDNKSFKLALSFNETYANINEYISETYGCDDATLMWECVVMDNDNIYNIQIKQSGPIQTMNIPFDTFTSWNSWSPGLMIQGSVSMSTAGTEPFMTIFSGKIPLTRELFSKMIVDKKFPSFINLNDLDMNNINLNVTNKIIQNVTVVSPTDSTKKHIIQPVFYQVRELGNVILHPGTNENISLNLDSYKSKVTTFKVQIEGVTFSESGRTNKGVVFNIIGNMLPREETNGTLYVLDENGTLVTTGKYIYND